MLLQCGFWERTWQEQVIFRYDNDHDEDVYFVLD
jgi:hypothetical protein